VTAGRWVTALAGVLLVAALAWALFVVLPDWYSSDSQSAASPAPVTTSSRASTPKIKATLFFVAENGASLMETEREIPFGEGVLEQGRHILEAQFATPAAPLVSPIPAGTTLRAFFVGNQGRAYVDLGSEVVTANPGGSLNERLTVAAIVESLTANLPAIIEVQILVGGHEVDTLAGHVDLRRAWTRHALLPAVPLPGASFPEPPKPARN